MSLPVEETDPRVVLGARRVATPGEPPFAWVVREEPLLLEVEGERVLTMRTPGADEALALGFLLGEGIVRSRDEVVSLERIAATGDGPAAAVDVVRVALAEPARARGASGALTRTHEIRASCGLCGRASGEALAKGFAELRPGLPRIPRARLAELVRGLEAEQVLFRATGGCHGAALFSAGGELWSAAEDVGRHNALDKAIGLAALAGRDLREGVAVLSGRGGFELVLKALRVGVAVVVSVSAASSLAVEVADEAGATLVGFVRPGKPPRVYVDDGRLA